MRNNNLAPIVLFVYNRPDHTLKTLEALEQNILASESILYIICDGPKEFASGDVLSKIKETRDIVKKKQWCKQVIIEEKIENLGLANSIIKGVTEIVNDHGKIIVLEDDIVTHKHFLHYMNHALNIFEHTPEVMHISSYIPSTTNQNKLPKVFFTTYMSCWGWATWKDMWAKATFDAMSLKNRIISERSISEFNYYNTQKNLYEQLELNINKKLKTWAIKWYASIFLEKGLVLTPRYSFVQNIGFDDSGENCTSDINLLYNTDLSKTNYIEFNKIKIKESRRGKKYLKRFFKYGKDSSFIQRIKMNYYWYIRKRLIHK